MAGQVRSVLTGCVLLRTECLEWKASKGVSNFGTINNTNLCDTACAALH